MVDVFRDDCADELDAAESFRRSSGICLHKLRERTPNKTYIQMYRSSPTRYPAADHDYSVRSLDEAQASTDYSGMTAG